MARALSAVSYAILLLISVSAIAIVIFATRAVLQANRHIVDEDEIELTSVGVDIGSSTSHLVFSRLVLERLDNRYIVDIFDSVAQSRSVSGYTNQPRTYGVAARFKW